VEGRQNLFGDGYPDLSDTALYYIGVIKHAALNAITNRDQFVQRLVPGSKRRSNRVLREEPLGGNPHPDGEPQGRRISAL
jgi:hypothetical protein